MRRGSGSGLHPNSKLKTQQLNDLTLTLIQFINDRTRIPIYKIHSKNNNNYNNLNRVH